MGVFRGGSSACVATRESRGGHGGGTGALTLTMAAFARANFLQAE